MALTSALSLWPSTATVKSTPAPTLERKRQHIQRDGAEGCAEVRHKGRRKRRLRKLAGRQRRYQKHTNHVISKALVLDAERTSRGIALEQLKGIRQRVTARGGNQRARLGNWGFADLGAFVAYKAKRLGVQVVFVDPRNTSRECLECGCVDKKNRYPAKPPSNVSVVGMKPAPTSTPRGTSGLTGDPRKGQRSVS